MPIALVLDVDPTSACSGRCCAPAMLNVRRGSGKALFNFGGRSAIRRVLKPRELETLPLQRGFVLVRERGSHRHLTTQADAAQPYPSMLATLHPHPLRTIAPDVGLSVDQLFGRPFPPERPA